MTMVEISSPLRLVASVVMGRGPDSDLFFWVMVSASLKLQAGHLECMIWRVLSSAGSMLQRVGPAVLADELVEFRKAEAEFSRGRAFDLHFPRLYPAAECGSGNSKVVASCGGIHPWLGFRVGSVGGGAL